MSRADELFIDMCRDILENGTSTEGEKVRPHWPDGTPAYTIKKFGVVNRYDLSKEFPIMTLRKTALKSATDEILWIYQKKSNNINDLNSRRLPLLPLVQGCCLQSCLCMPLHQQEGYGLFVSRRMF